MNSLCKFRVFNIISIIMVLMFILLLGVFVNSNKVKVDLYFK